MSTYRGVLLGFMYDLCSPCRESPQFVGFDCDFKIVFFKDFIYFFLDIFCSFLVFCCMLHCTKTYISTIREPIGCVKGNVLNPTN